MDSAFFLTVYNFSLLVSLSLSLCFTACCACSKHVGKKWLPLPLGLRMAESRPRGGTEVPAGCFGSVSLSSCPSHCHLFSVPMIMFSRTIEVQMAFHRCLHFQMQRAFLSSLVVNGHLLCESCDFSFSPGHF